MIVALLQGRGKKIVFRTRQWFHGHFCDNTLFHSLQNILVEVAYQKPTPTYI